MIQRSVFDGGIAVIRPRGTVGRRMRFELRPDLPVTPLVASSDIPRNP
jgi:hypothetical protein